MRSFESNLAFLIACLEELEDYERAETLFWTLSARPPAGGPPFLQMTLGNLILALDEMRAVEAGLSLRQRADLLRAQTTWEARWASRSARLEGKARHEATSRIGQWRAYVAESTETGDLADYAANVRPRLCAVRLLEWLGTSGEGTGESLAELEALDAALEPHTEDGPCVLGAEMAGVYPPVDYYRFLYRRARRGAGHTRGQAS